MSLLTDNEKIIIARLKESPNGRDFIANVIDNELKGARIRVDKNAKKAFILVEKNYYTNLSEAERNRINQVFNWVTYIISISFVLVDFLDQCGFVSMRTPDVKDAIATIGPGLDEPNAHMFEVLNPFIVDSLIKYIDNIIILKDGVETL